MASTLNDIIADAFRESNLVPLVGTPTDAEIAEGLDRLNILLASVLGNEVGLELADLNIGGEFDQSAACSSFIPENARLVLTDMTDNLSYDLHPQPYDGQRFALVDGSNNLGTYTVTLDGNGRKVEGASTLDILTQDDVGQWMYRADLADWVRLTELGEGDDMPFPGEFDDYFTVMLAMRLNPRNSVSLSQESAAALERSRKQLKARYRRPRPTQELPTLGLMGSGGSRYGSTNAFNRGRIW